MWRATLLNKWFRSGLFCWQAIIYSSQLRQRLIFPGFERAITAQKTALVQVFCDVLNTQRVSTKKLPARWSAHFFFLFFVTVALRERKKKKTASQQCSKPDVHTSGYKGGWMLADWLRPPAAAVTILQDVLWTNVCFWLFGALAKKASLTASSFSLPIQLMFHTPLLKIVPNQAPPPTHPQDFALAFVSVSSSSTLINALMRNCNSILCQGEMEIERRSNTELPSHHYYSHF